MSGEIWGRLLTTGSRVEMPGFKRREIGGREGEGAPGLIDTNSLFLSISEYGPGTGL